MRDETTAYDRPAEIDLSQGRSRAKWVYALLVALLLLLAFVALALRHSGHLRLALVDGEARVERGAFAPFGWVDHQPSTAFKPIKIDADVPARLGECADLADCEGRLCEIAIAQARRELRRPDRMAEAMALIAQATRLAGPAQREALRALEDEEQLARGLARLEEARRVLAEARHHFFSVRGRDAEAISRAEAWTLTIDAVLDDLDTARDPRRARDPDRAIDTPKAAPSAPRAKIPDGASPEGDGSRLTPRAKDPDGAAPDRAPSSPDAGAQGEPDTEPM